MPRKDEKQIKTAREASEEKRGGDHAKISPEAKKMEKSMSQDELRKQGTKPGSGSSKR